LWIQVQEQHVQILEVATVLNDRITHDFSFLEWTRLTTVWSQLKFKIIFKSNFYDDQFLIVSEIKLLIVCLTCCVLFSQAVEDKINVLRKKCGQKPSDRTSMLIDDSNSLIHPGGEGSIVADGTESERSSLSDGQPCVSRIVYCGCLIT